MGWWHSQYDGKIIQMFQTTSSHLVCEAKGSSTPSVSVFEGGLGKSRKFTAAIDVPLKRHERELHSCHLLLLLLLLCYVCGAFIFTLSRHRTSMFFWYLLHWQGLWWKHILMPLPNQWEQCFPTRSTKKYATNTAKAFQHPMAARSNKRLEKARKRNNEEYAKQQNSKWRKRKSRQAESGEPNKVHKQTSARKTETCFTWIFFRLSAKVQSQHCRRYKGNCFCLVDSYRSNITTG